jgi:hypothetical protein
VRKKNSSRKPKPDWREEKDAERLRVKRLKKQTQASTQLTNLSPPRPRKGRNLLKSGQRLPEVEEKVSVGRFGHSSNDLESMTFHSSTSTVWEQDYSWGSPAPEGFDDEDRRERKSKDERFKLLWIV